MFPPGPSWASLSEGKSEFVWNVSSQPVHTVQDFIMILHTMSLDSTLWLKSLRRLTSCNPQLFSDIMFASREWCKTHVVLPLQLCSTGQTGGGCAHGLVLRMWMRWDGAPSWKSENKIWEAAFHFSFSSMRFNGCDAASCGENCTLCVCVCIHHLFICLIVLFRAAGVTFPEVWLPLHQDEVLSSSSELHWWKKDNKKMIEPHLADATEASVLSHSRAHVLT